MSPDFVKSQSDEATVDDAPKLLRLWRASERIGTLLWLQTRMDSGFDSTLFLLVIVIFFSSRGSVCIYEENLIFKPSG